MMSMKTSLDPFFIVAICLILFGLLFLVSYVIHRFSKKEPKTSTLKIALIIWCIIFVINLIATLFNIPLVIGFNHTPAMDGGVNGKYISFGYAIEIEGHNLVGESNYNIYFTSLF